MNAVDCLAHYSHWVTRIEELLREIPPEHVSSRFIHAWEKGKLLTPTWKNNELFRMWFNVIAHQVAVAYLAYRISERLPDNSVVSDVTEAALIHDWFKRREAEIISTAKEKGEDMAVANHKAEVTSANLLARIGFSKAVVLISKATGDFGLDIMLSGKGTISQKIVFYSDCCVSDDNIVGYQRRFDDLLPHFQSGGRYDWVNAAFIVKHGKTHREVYDSVVLPIQREIADLAGFAGDPNDFLSYLLDNYRLV